MVTLSIKIIKYSSANKKELLKLLNQTWRELDKNEIKKRFEWRYEKNPYQVEPFVYIAVDGNRVVGCRAYVVQLFQLMKTKYFIFFELFIFN